MQDAPNSAPPPEHPVLARQLRRAGFERASLPADLANWQSLLAAIARAYTQADQDRALVERSLRVSSDEMRQLHERLERRNAELETARAAAEAASASKSQFLANMSHEIRTPMNAILGFVDLLLESVCPDAQRLEYGQTIRRNATHLLTVIDDILDFSKIEAGRMTLERSPVDLATLIDEVRSLMSQRAGAKGLKFNFEIAALSGVVVQTDPIRVRQVLLNLVSNAVKFTEAGAVTVGASCSREGGQATIRIDVTDTGIGLTADEIAGLFRPFTQADTTTTRRFGGTGLGLAISRRLAELLGGAIEVRSTPGAGSTFTLVLNTQLVAPAPVEAPSPVPAAAAPHEALRGARILLVEDGADNQRLISHFLSKASVEVQMVENGQLAVDRVTAPGAPAFDVILMDMQMPVMDGYTATSTLRALGIRTPIVALTAHAMSGDREKCVAAGCDDYCTKPINKATLIAVCAKWIGKTTASAVQQPAA